MCFQNVIPVRKCQPVSPSDRRDDHPPEEEKRIKVITISRQSESDGASRLSEGDRPGSERPVGKALRGSSTRSGMQLSIPLEDV